MLKSLFFTFKATLSLTLVALVASLLLLPVGASDYSADVSRALAEGKRLYDLGQYSSAKSQFNDALKLEPNCPDAYNWLGLCVDKEGDRAQAKSFYQLAIKQNEDLYDGLYNLANSYYIDRDYSQSIVYYLRALKVRDKYNMGLDPDLFASLATVYRDRAASLSGLPRQQDMARALDFYQRSLKLNPRNPQAHAMLGRLYFDENKLSAAEKELRTAVSLEPKYAYAFYMLGRIYRQKKEYPAALVAFQNSVKCENRADYKKDTESQILSLGLPRPVVDYFAQGFENLSLSNWELAQNEFQAASGLNTGMKAVALNNYGFSLLKAGNLAAAISAFRAALKESPHGLPEAHYNLGLAYFQSNRLLEAEQSLKQCLAESKGNHYLAHNVLGMVYKAKGNLNEALNQYNLALMQSGDCLSVVQFNRAALLEALGRKQEALAGYNKYLLFAPSGLNVVVANERIQRLK